MNVKPSIQALWLADDVSQDPNTGKVNIKGLFDEITAPGPGQPFTSPAYIFFGLRGIHGSVQLSLRYIDLSDGSILIDWPLALTCSDPLTTLDVVLRLPALPIPHDGVYLWELGWGNEVIGSSRLTAHT